MNARVAAEYRSGIRAARLHVKLTIYAVRMNMSAETFMRLTDPTMPKTRRALDAYVRTINKAREHIESLTQKRAMNPIVREGYHD